MDSKKRSQPEKATWSDKQASFTELFEQCKQRVDACMTQSPGIQACKALAEELFQALESVQLQDLRTNSTGEDSRIMARAAAMKAALEKQDLFIIAPPTPTWGCPIVKPESPDWIPPVVQAPKQVRKHLAGEEDEPDATPDQCVFSICLLMASLFEKTPFSNTELRKKIYQDFSILKRDFRQDSLTTMQGMTSSIGDLFDSIKDLDKRGQSDNLLGILFEDWNVHKRVDNFLVAEQLKVQVTALTSDGPIGKFFCRLRTFVTLTMLHQRLLKDLFDAEFVNYAPPRGAGEMMTNSDPLDFMDFIEAMTRHTPANLSTSEKLYLAWMYAPEINALPEVWEQIFGHGTNRLPTMYDKVHTKDDAVCFIPELDDYGMELKASMHHDFLEASSQTAVAYPWADDLIGSFLRKVKSSHRTGGNPASDSSADSPSQPINNTDASSLAPYTAPQLSSSTASGDAAALVQPSEAHISSSSCANSFGQAHVPGGHSHVPVARVQEYDLGENNYTVPNALETGKLCLPLGIFLVGIICSGAYTNTQIHLEDLLLCSININIFGWPKIWWWIPQDNVQQFKEYAEDMTDGGREDLYTKSIGPFIKDKELCPPEHVLPLQKLKELGARRAIQMPGMGILTSPGYAFHFTVSLGFNIAESCNMFLEMLGWTFDKLWEQRPAEQYPEDAHDMARYMRDTGILAALGIPDKEPLSAEVVHAMLARRNSNSPGKAGSQGGTHPKGCKQPAHIRQEPSLARPGSRDDALGSIKLIAPMDVPLDKQLKCHPLCHCQKHAIPT